MAKTSQITGRPPQICGCALSLSRAVRPGDFIFPAGEARTATGNIEDQTRALRAAPAKGKAA